MMGSEKNPTADLDVDLNPITVEVINESMISTVREMRANLVATAYSSIIYEAHDFSCVLVDGEGQIIAQEEDNPSHIFPVPWSVKAMFERFGEDIQPGDVFLHNDPYTGGTHLNDIAMIFPVFTDGELLLFSAVRAHWGDVGGMTPGSISGKNTEILHDGIRLPIMRVAEAGRLNDSVLDLMFANMRMPRERRGDFLSTWGSCQVAERRISELMDKFGAATVKASMHTLLDRSERRMRRRIAALEDGEFVYEHFLDPLTLGGEPIRARVTIKVEGDGLVVDFSGSSAQLEASMNSGAAVAATGAFIVLKAFLDPGEPVNHGNFRPIDVRVPEGCFFNARYPASCAGSSEVRHAAISVVLGAIGRAFPDLMCGDIKGTANHVYISGRHPGSGEMFLFYEYPAGGTGGFRGSDGNAAIRNFAEGDFSSIQPAEAIEHESPLLVERCEIRMDSGGAGAHRGGPGLRRDIRLLSEAGSLSVASNKNIIPPFGVNGGLSGAPNTFVVYRDDKALQPSDSPGKVASFPLCKDDVVSISSSGGGGWGDPLARNPEAVLVDVVNGAISLEASKNVYGVVLRNMAVDPEATDTLRTRLADDRVFLSLVIRPDSGTGNGDEENRTYCDLAPETFESLGLDSTTPIELVGPVGPALRVWARPSTEVSSGKVRIGSLSEKILGLPVDTPIEVRRMASQG